MKDIFIIEDHDQALKVWQDKGVKSLDLVHIDAHIDFGFPTAQPLEEVVNNAKTLKELRERLEYSIAYLNYEKDFKKQTNIGNYIYPAIQQAIVRDIYWVIPGDSGEFKKSKKLVKNILKNIAQVSRMNGRLLFKETTGMICANILGRDFKVCILKTLPQLNKDTLLDIDTDFLVIDSIRHADNTSHIGKRRPWLMPQELIKRLRAQIKKPAVTTIAYSVNGGWTPARYRHFADEIAYCFAPSRFRKRLGINRRAARYFNLFEASGKRIFYRRATGLNPAYRLADNNYGFLYLELRKFSLAKKEFVRILKVDANNPAAILGLGIIALEARRFKKAKRYFLSSMRFANREKSFSGIKKQAILQLGKAEFFLGNLKEAKRHLIFYKRAHPLEAQPYFFLGCLVEKQGDLQKAVTFYKDAIRLGLTAIDPLFRLIKISHRLKDKSDIIEYVKAKFKFLKNELTGLDKLRRKKKRVIGYTDFKRKITVIRKILKGDR